MTEQGYEFHWKPRGNPYLLHKASEPRIVLDVSNSVPVLPRGFCLPCVGSLPVYHGTSCPSVLVEKTKRRGKSKTSASGSSTSDKSSAVGRGDAEVSGSGSEEPPPLVDAVEDEGANGEDASGDQGHEKKEECLGWMEALFEDDEAHENDEPYDECEETQGMQRHTGLPCAACH